MQLRRVVRMLLSTSAVERRRTRPAMTSSPQRIQRTLAILRGAAADEVGRRSVEARITESGFDLLNERFIDSEEGLVAGPAVVLVLQRHRAISVRSPDLVC